jgi:hypothetical protein
LPRLSRKQTLARLKSSHSYDVDNLASLVIQTDVDYGQGSELPEKQEVNIIFSISSYSEKEAFRLQETLPISMKFHHFDNMTFIDSNLHFIFLQTTQGNSVAKS